jgi:ATP-dependent DNA ligase
LRITAHVGKSAASVHVTSRRGILQKLLLGVPKSDGRLHYAGNVGTGFSEKMRRDLGEGLAMITTDESSFALGQVCRNNNV